MLEVFDVHTHLLSLHILILLMLFFHRVSLNDYYFQNRMQSQL